MLYVAGSVSRFPDDARFIYRAIEDAIRRQPSDARHIFALTTYDEAVPVLIGSAKPLILSANDGPRRGEIVDPIQLVLPVELDASEADTMPETDGNHAA